MKILNLLVPLSVIMCLVGANIQIDMQGVFLSELKSVYIPKILDKIKDIHIGNIPLPVNKKHMGANVTSSEIQLTYKNADKDVSVSVDKSVKILISGIDLDVHCNLSQWFFFIKNTHGHIHAQITNLTLAIEFTPDTQVIGPFNSLAFAVNIEDASFDFDKAHSNIKISGGALPWTENIVESLIQKWLFKFLTKNI
jgi:hypothetical protein